MTRRKVNHYVDYKTDTEDIPCLDSVVLHPARFLLGISADTCGCDCEACVHQVRVTGGGDLQIGKMPDSELGDDKRSLAGVVAVHQPLCD